MSTQTFGIVTALDPPVTIGATDYGVAVEFNRYPTNRVASPIVSARNVSITSESGNIKRVVMERADQVSTATTSPGVESEWRSRMGGNVAATLEPGRIYNHVNSRSFRGSDAADRVLPGDRARVTIGAVERSFKVVTAVAFAQAPSGGTNWAGDAPLPTPGSIAHAVNSVVLTTTPGAAILFDPDDSALYAGCGVAWRNLTAFTTGAVARKIFDNPDGDPEPDLYPEDATFADSQLYWYDARGRSFRFGSVGMGLVGANAIDVTLWQRVSSLNATLTPELATSAIVLDTDDAPAGYDTTADALALTAVSIVDDFTVELTIQDADVSGDCSLEFRETTAAGSRVAALVFSGTGTVETIQQRATTGGSIGTVATISEPYSFPFQVRAALVGSTLTFSHRQGSGDAWNHETGLSLAHEGGRLGVGTTAGVRFTGTAVALLNAPIGCESRLAVQQVQSFTGLAWSAAYTLPASTAFTSITNRTTGAAMIPGTTALARNVYVRSGTTLTLFSESSGDTIDFVLAASGSAPTPPGTAPRAGGTTNFADGSNVGNYHDVIELHDPHDEIPLTAGQTFTFTRDPVFDSQNPPSFEYDVKDRVGSDWTAFDPGDIFVLAAEGIVYISAAFIASLAITGGEALCVRAIGPKFAQRGGVSALPINDAVNAVEGMDQFSAGASLAFAVGSSIGGLTDAGGGAFVPYPSGFTCDGTYWIPDDVVYGTRKTRFHNLSDALDAAGVGFGGYFFDTSFNPPLTYRDTAERVSYLSADDTTLPTCGSNPPKTAHDANAEGDFPFDITPDGNYGPSLVPFGMLQGVSLDPAAQYFGGHCVPSGYSYGYAPGVAAEFGFQGVAFTPAGWLTRVPDGATVVSADALIRAVGLRICSWNITYELQPDGTLRLRYYRGDAAIEYDGPVTGGPVTTFDKGTAAGSSGAISLALVGRERDSRKIHIVGGGEYPLASTKFRHLGSGLSISAADAGKWKKVSVTEMLQKLVANRNSLAADFELWPTLATVEPDDGAGGLAGYLRGLMPATSCSLNSGPNGTWGFDASASGSYAIIPQGIEISTIRATLRLPSGILADEVIATPQSAMIAGWS